MRRPGPDAFLISAVLAAALAWMAGCIGTETTNPHNIAPDSEPVVHGRLVDGTGNPIGGAVVKVYPSEASPLGEAAPKASAGEARAETNANGFYSFKDIPRGRYNLIGE